MKTPKGSRSSSAPNCGVVMTSFEEKLKPAYRPYFRAVFLEGRDWEDARLSLGLSRLRTKYLKSVLLKLLQRHGPLLELLGRGKT